MKRFVRNLFTPALVVVAMLALIQPTCAQSKSTARPAVRERNLFMKAHNYGDSIVLRWNVNEGAYWLAANKRGYILERIEFGDPKARPVRKRLTVAPIRPWTLDSMKKRLPRNDRFVAIAAQILHGKTYSESPKGTIGDFYQTYQQQQGQLLTAAMAAEFSAAAANALGLRWTDRTFDRKATRCVYRLWINNGPQPKPGDLTDTATVLVLPWRVDSLVAPKVAGTESGDKVVKLRWYRYHKSGNFSGYYVERSSDGKTFTRLNEVPYVAAPPDTTVRFSGLPKNPQEVEYTDSVRVNYRKFQYRIIGINTFGDLSPVSKVLVGNGRDLTPPRPPIDIQKKVEDNRRIIITWSLPAPAPDLKGFYIGQASEFGGPYQPLNKTLLPPSARTFTNEKPVPYFGKYYVVAVVDTAGNVAYSAPITAMIEDRTPPIAPKGVRAKVDTSGIVTIQWPNSPESDVLGYKVYRSYEQDNEYYEQRTIGILADSMFVDTLPSRTLTRQAFYKIIAVDFSNNHSGFSAPITVALPDKVPPATPIIQAALVENHAIRLRLIPSLSDDVVEHTLYRREPTGVWREITKIPGHPTANLVVLDSALTHEQTYEYSLVARDWGGLQSERSFVVSAQYIDLRKLVVAAPSGLKAVYDPKQKQIRIEWVCKPPETMYHYLIYRGINGEAISTYKQVRGTNTFTDTTLPTEGVYEYAVRLVLPEDQSKLSETGKVTYRK